RRDRTELMFQVASLIFIDVGPSLARLMWKFDHNKKRRPTLGGWASNPRKRGAPGGKPAQASASTARRGALPMKIDVTRLWEYRYACSGEFQSLFVKKINEGLMRSRKLAPTCWSGNS
ncbi:MAG: hypothetical protein AAGF14_04455, partial [Pseudomonadota bacterium]